MPDSTDREGNKVFDPSRRFVIEIYIDGGPSNVDNPTPESVASHINEMMQTSTDIPWWGFAKVYGT